MIGPIRDVSAAACVALNAESSKNDGKLNKKWVANGINKLRDRIYSILTKQPKPKV